ncbi:putative transcription factor interactor and regulator CCHC(Zn) family [Helianthus annuus]|nr:putative transcription factor interactor and regulator CCHC(Zn) family [Helianthus annuus]
MFVTNIENSDLKPNFSQLRTKLLTHESQLKRSASQFTSSVSIYAMAAMHINNSPHDSSNKSSVVCQICEKSEHKASICYFRFSCGNGGRSGGGRWRGGRNSGGRSGGRHNNEGYGGRNNQSYGGVRWQNDVNQEVIRRMWLIIVVLGFQWMEKMYQVSLVLMIHA